MTQLQKEQILAARNEGIPLSDELKQVLLESVKKGHPSIFDNDDDNICCDLGIDPPNRYQKTSRQNCDILGGTVVDDSHCS